MEIFEFCLSQDEQNDVLKLLSPSVASRWYAPLLASCFALQIVAVALGGRYTFWATGQIVVNALGIFVLLFAMRQAAKKQRLAIKGLLRLSPTGLSGTIDGKAMTLPWREITSASNLDCFIVLFRQTAGPIALPKSSLTDPTALWSVLDERLVGKRGLVRSGSHRERIFNTTY